MNHEPNTPESRQPLPEYEQQEPASGTTSDLPERPAHQVSPIDRLPESVSREELAARSGSPAPKGGV